MIIVVHDLTLSKVKKISKTLPAISCVQRDELNDNAILVHSTAYHDQWMVYRICSAFKEAGGRISIEGAWWYDKYKCV